jgi:hypothetical protein
MTFRTPVAFSLTLLLLGQTNAFAAPAPLELKWNELNAAIYGQIVELTLPGAATVKGEVAAVREDGLVLEVKKTSDAKAFPKGNAVIPRSSVILLKLEKRRGTNWRMMGTTLGVLGGVVLGGYIAAKTANSPGSGIAVFLASASAISVAGHLAGRAADKRTTLIRIAQ